MWYNNFEVTFRTYVYIGRKITLQILISITIIFGITLKQKKLNEIYFKKEKKLNICVHILAPKQKFWIFKCKLCIKNKVILITKYANNCLDDVKYTSKMKVEKAMIITRFC